MNKASDEGSDRDWALTGLPMGEGPPVQVAAGPTPGPWALEYCIDGGFEVSGTDPLDRVVIAGRQPIPGRHGEFVANARIIAAAPELLQALKAFVEMDDPKPADPKSDEPISISLKDLLDLEDRVLALARAAIAKAEGR